MNTPKFGRINRTRIIMFIMIGIVVILTALVIILFVLSERKNRKADPQAVENTPTPGQTVSLVTATPEVKATDTPVIVKVNTPTPTQEVKITPSPLPTAIPVPVEKEYAGLNLVPALVRNKVKLMADMAVADVNIWGGSNAKDPDVTIDTYVYPAFVSILIKCDAKGSATEHRIGCTFDAATGKQLAASEVFRESYLAVIKERLQKLAPEEDSAFLKTDFVKYDTAYKASDYDSFCIHDNKVTFVFGNGTLTELIHNEFVYDAPYSEAKAFMYKDTDGKPVGVQVREGLDPNKPMVAFTYDDGPYEVVESKLLKILDKYNAKCTFFTIGERIDGAKSSLRSIQNIAKAGHEVGSHTYSHTSFRKEDCDKELFWTEINKNNLTIAKAVGYAPTLIRMPGGNDKLIYMAKHLPMPMINWFLDTMDWNKGIIYPEKSTQETIDAKVDEITKTVLDSVADGQIILMHSLYYTSAEATDKIMEELSAKGYQFVTVSELFYYKGITLENGKVSYATNLKGNINRDYSKIK